MRSSSLWLFTFSITILFALCQSTYKERSSSCDSSNCVLPLCKCPNKESPEGVSLADIPMMVVISFNGVIPSRSMKYFKKILNPIFKNPNGCPTQATFFVSDKMDRKETDYCVVQNLFNNNNEIAVGSVKYKCPYTKCELHDRSWKSKDADKIIYEQKKNIARLAKINRSFIRGFRTPHLDQAGNAHFGALKKYAFNYDSSVVIKQRDIKDKASSMRFWPHTLDFKPSYDCSTCPNKKSFCRNKDNCSMNSVWVVPMHTLTLIDDKKMYFCPSLIKDEIAENRINTKDCLEREQLTQTLLEKMLFTNFELHYKTNKAPFILNIETEWFDEFGEMLTGALQSFINALTDTENEYTKKDDIYFLSISKIIEWMQYPVATEVIANQWLWDCDGSTYDYDEDCQNVIKAFEKIEKLEEIKKKNMTKKMELDLQGEDLYRNGVLTVVAASFACLMVLTLCFDKYG